jgi:hypothetical protein
MFTAMIDSIAKCEKTPGEYAGAIFKMADNFGNGSLKLKV